MTSTPPGADIVIDGYECGMTPQSFLLKKNIQHDVIVTKDGYQPEAFHLNSYTNPLVGTNAFPPVVLGGIGAGIGLATADPFAVVVFGMLGVITGAVMGICGFGVDVLTGSSSELTTSEVQAHLKLSN